MRGGVGAAVHNGHLCAAQLAEAVVEELTRKQISNDTVVLFSNATIVICGLIHFIM